ncbi:MAG: BlaI/MecI/CopY family transcriptional regulator [Catenulispora sp.]|nr:BlaI/MecI/CopY family transcriptional regulator [Catenulispora sp.]
MRGLGELESAVMGLLWDQDAPATVREVLLELQRTRPLAYATILTVLENLHRKGFVSRVRDGRAYRYLPTRSRTDYAAELMGKAMVDSGDPAAALLRFVEQIPPEQVGRLRRALQDGAGVGHDTPRSAS